MEFENSRWRKLATTLCLVGLGASCGDGPTGLVPRDVSDVERLHEEFTSVRASFLANTDVAADLRHVTPVLDTLQPPLPSDLLGSTFEWSEGADGYVVTGRSGAPADGLRFIVYDRSASPFTEVGFVDVTDEGDVTPGLRGVHVEKDDITRLDYVIDESAPAPGDIAAAGFIAGGVRRADFDVSQIVSRLPDGFLVELDYSLALTEPSITLDVDYTLDVGLVTPGIADFVATFVDGPDRLVIDMTQRSGGIIDGIGRSNGEVAFTIDDDGTGQPLFLGPEGEELPAEEERAARGLFDLSFSGVIDLLIPYLILSDTDAGEGTTAITPS